MSVTTISWLLWAVCLAIGIACFRPSRCPEGRFRWTNPKTAFGFAFMIFHVVRPLHLLLTGDYYGVRLRLVSVVNPGEMNDMLLASAIGGTAFLIGWHMTEARFRNRGRRVQQPSRGSSTYRSADYYIKRAGLLLPFAAYALLRGASGNVPVESVNVYYFFRAALLALPFLLLVGAVISRGRYLYLGAALAGSCYLWLFWRETGTSRLFLLLFLVPGIVLAASAGARRAIIIVVVLLSLSAGTFLFLGSARDGLRNGASIGEQFETIRSAGWDVLPGYFLRGGDFEAFEKGVLIMRLIPAQDPPYLGGSFATLLVLPIPRSLWPEKPVVSPTETIRKWYPNIPENFAITLIAEAYANWLWPGVVFVPLGLGALSRWVQQKSLLMPCAPEGAVLMGLFMAYVILVMRGSFHTMTAYYLFCQVWFSASAWVVKALQPEVRRSLLRRPPL